MNTDLNQATCPSCAHKFQLPLSIYRVDSFDKHLTTKAKLIHNTRLNETLFEIVECTKCKTWAFPKREPVTEQVHGIPATTFTSKYSAFEKEHPEQNGCEVLLKVKAMQYLGIAVHITLKEVLICHKDELPNLIESRINTAAKKLATVYNTCIDQGWLNYGTLLPCSVMKLATIGLDERYLLACYTASDFTYQELNAKLGKQVFSQDGELPTSW